MNKPLIRPYFRAGRYVRGVDKGFIRPYLRATNTWTQMVDFPASHVIFQGSLPFNFPNLYRLFF